MPNQCDAQLRIVEPSVSLAETDDVRVFPFCEDVLDDVVVAILRPQLGGSQDGSQRKHLESHHTGSMPLVYL